MQEIWKRRRIRITRPGIDDWRERLQQSLTSVAGVRACRIRESGTVEVEYNLRTVRFEQIADLVRSAGCKLHPGPWERMKHRFIRYTEQNELDQLTAPQRPCCSNPRFR